MYRLLFRLAEISHLCILEVADAQYFHSQIRKISKFSIRLGLLPHATANSPDNLPARSRKATNRASCESDLIK